MWLWYSLLSGFTRRGVVERMIANERLKVFQSSPPSNNGDVVERMIANERLKGRDLGDLLLLSLLW